MPPVTRRTVAAAFADHGGRLAGDGRFVDRGDPLDHFAVAGDRLPRPRPAPCPPCAGPSAGTSLYAARFQSVGDRLGAHLAQRVGLGLAAALGDRLGEIGEQHREPQPQRDRCREPQRAPLPATAWPCRGSPAPWSARCPARRRTSPGFCSMMLRRQLDQAVQRRSAGSPRRTAKSIWLLGHPYRSREIFFAKLVKLCLRLGRKRSTIGPSDSAGKNVKAPTMITTPISSSTNSSPSVGNVPRPAGTFFLVTIDPADGQHRNDHQESARQAWPRPARCSTRACSRSGRRTPSRCFPCRSRRRKAFRSSRADRRCSTTSRRTNSPAYRRRRSFARPAAAGAGPPRIQPPASRKSRQAEKPKMISGKIRT